MIFSRVKNLLGYKTQKGITLIESLVAIAIFVILMLVAAGFIYAIYRAQGYSFDKSQAINEARKGTEAMVKEIREAQAAQDGSYAIITTGELEFSFYGDIDKDSSIEKVRYFVEGTDFKKGVIEPTSVSQLGDMPPRYLPENEHISILSRYVRNSAPIFRYFDGSGNELSAASRKRDTKIMRLYLVINVNLDRPPNNFYLESETQIRNLKNNL